MSTKENHSSELININGFSLLNGLITSINYLKIDNDFFKTELNILRDKIKSIERTMLCHQCSEND